MLRAWKRRRAGRRPAGRAGAATDTENGNALPRLLAEIEDLTSENRGGRDPEIERRIVSLRHRAGLALVDGKPASGEYPAPAFDQLPDGAQVPEIGLDELTAEVLRAAILRNGCLLVRGAIDPDEAAHLVDEMNHAFTARDDRAAGRSAEDGYYEEFVPDPRFELGPHRRMVSDPNNLWPADSPRLMIDLLELFEHTGLRTLVADYLGERPAVSVTKSTLRRISADVYKGGGSSTSKPISLWHQDGAFLGEVRALNMWLALSRCGDIAPGLDLIPRRLDHIVPTGTEGATFDWSVSHTVAEQVAGEAGIVRPIFEPGDMLLFDELFLHTTAGGPEMSSTRYAVECWFFGTSAFPGEYPPIAL